jgi:hypothetical protein
MEEQGTKSSSKIFLIFKVFALFIAIAFIVGLLWVKHTFYASEFRPTELTPGEQKVLESKLGRLGESAVKDQQTRKGRPSNSITPLKPEPYSEEGALREIQLTEKELNALIANNSEAAQRVAIDLSDNLVSVKLVVPIDEEIPVLGGKTLRLNLGVILGYENEQLIVALKGVSLGGIPLPNAWLGNLKEKNLIKEFGSDSGFWHLFEAGVQDITVKEGNLKINLKE